MATVRIGNLLEVRKYDDNTDQWVTDLRFQNSNNDGTVGFQGQPWRFLPFIYQGATRSRTGNNIEAGLILSTNPISMGYAQRVVELKLKVVIYTCVMNAEFNLIDQLISKDNWSGTSMTYDSETIEVNLASRVDAITFGIPNMYLKKAIVGNLPTTANLTAR